VKIDFYWSRDFDSIEGKVMFPDMKQRDYRYAVPKNVYRSTVSLKRTAPESFNLSIDERPEGMVFQSPFPVQEIDFMAMALKPLDGSEGRDCKRNFLLDRSMLDLYRMSKDEVMKNIFVVLSSVDGYRFRFVRQ